MLKWLPLQYFLFFCLAVGRKKQQFFFFFLKVIQLCMSVAVTDPFIELQ